MGFLVARFRTLFWTAFYHTLGRLVFERVGRGSCFEGWIEAPYRGGRIRIGNHVRVCRFVQFTVVAGAELNIGDDVFIGRNTVINAAKRITIGADTLIAAYVSIHDNNHATFDETRPIRTQGYTSEPMEIGSDSWIGTRATLVQGSGMGERCILGAGAVLTRKLPDCTTAAGVPARPLVSRGSSSEMSLPTRSAPETHDVQP